MKNKLLTIISILTLVLALTGCSKAVSLLDTPFVEEDFDRSDFGRNMETLIHETDEGIYYTNYLTGPDLHYYDKKTNTSIYLCNKPECAHDGNEFCVATNSRYKLYDAAWYNGKIILAVTEQTDSQILYKLLAASPDGSALEEITTFFTTDNIGLKPTFEPFHDPGSFRDNRSSRMIIHRNKVFVILQLRGTNTKLDEPDYLGGAIVDLNTKAVTYLSEDPVSKENPYLSDMYGYHDYIYYMTYYPNLKPRKTRLVRYCISSNTFEEFEMTGLTRASGYTVLDDDTILYIRNRSTVVSRYSIKDGNYKDLNLALDAEGNDYASQVYCDGERVYVCSGVCLDNVAYGSGNKDEDMVSGQPRTVYVYGTDLETRLATVDITRLYSQISSHWVPCITFRGNTVFIHLGGISDDNGNHLNTTTLEEFISNTATLKPYYEFR